MYKLVIFDLDGTLLDTSEGIFNSVRYAEEQMNLEKISNEMLRKFVGPPPQKMYSELYDLNSEKSAEAVTYHREYGRTRAIYEATVYSGIEELLKKLKSNNCKIAVATLKSQDIAKTVLEHYSLSEYFDFIVGMNKDETLTKSDTIVQVLEYTNVQREDAVMIGDSIYDMEGAKEAGVDFIGVTYGFGFDENKENKYDSLMLDNVSELGKILLA